MADARKHPTYSHAELERILAWQERRNTQQAIYMARPPGKTVKNRGPMGSKRIWQQPRQRPTYFVTHDVKLDPGSVLPSGLVIPSTGAVMKGLPLCPPLHTRRQARKALARVRRMHPDARLCGYTSFSPGQTPSPTSIYAPDAPAGWWNVRAPHSTRGAPEPVPELTWPQLVLTARAP